MKTNYHPKNFDRLQHQRLTYTAQCLYDQEDMHVGMLFVFPFLVMTIQKSPVRRASVGPVPCRACAAEPPPPEAAGRSRRETTSADEPRENQNRRLLAGLAKSFPQLRRVRHGATRPVDQPHTMPQPARRLSRLFSKPRLTSRNNRSNNTTGKRALAKKFGRDVLAEQMRNVTASRRCHAEPGAGSRGAWSRGQAAVATNDDRLRNTTARSCPLPKCGRYST